MQSINFPNFLTNANTDIANDNEAILNNLKLLLKSQKSTLFGDPYFGTNLTSYLYRSTDEVLEDLIIEDIFVAIVEYIPQIRVNRRDIKVRTDGRTVYITIRAIKVNDNTSNLYDINITRSSK